MTPTTPGGARRALRELAAAVVAGGPAGCRLVEVAFRAAVEIDVDAGGARFVIWLRPVADPGRSYRTTTRFKVGYRGTPGRAGYDLIEALCARLAALEASLPADAERDLFEAEAPAWLSGADLELLAVASDLKPACRHIVAAGELAALSADVARRGLQAMPVRAADFVAGFHAGVVRGEDHIVYVGRTAAAATRAADAERAMIAAGSGDGADHPPMATLERAFGAALGYPPCCIDAYLTVNDRPNAEIRFRALQRTDGPAAWQLDNVDNRWWLISHFACRYDCAPSRTYAAALFDVLARADPAAAAALDRELRGLVVMFRDDGALRLAIAPAAAGGRHAVEAVRVSGAGPQLDAWRSVLRPGDELELAGDAVRVWRGAAMATTLDAPGDQVLVRAFA